MSTNYKHQYEQMKLLVEKYQDEIVPGLRKLNSDILAEVEKNFVKVVRCKNCGFLGWRGTNTNDCGYFYCRHPSGLRVIKDAHSSYCDYGERKDNET